MQICLLQAIDIFDQFLGGRRVAPAGPSLCGVPAAAAKGAELKTHAQTFVYKLKVVVAFVLCSPVKTLSTCAPRTYVCRHCIMLRSVHIFIYIYISIYLSFYFYLFVYFYLFMSGLVGLCAVCPDDVP